MITRIGLDAAISMIDKDIPEALEPYWATVKQFIDELPEDTLIQLLQSIANQINTRGNCLIIQQEEDLRVVKDIDLVLFKDLK